MQENQPLIQDPNVVQDPNAVQESDVVQQPESELEKIVGYMRKQNFSMDRIQKVVRDY